MASRQPPLNQLELERIRYLLEKVDPDRVAEIVKEEGHWQWLREKLMAFGRWAAWLTTLAVGALWAQKIVDFLGRLFAT